MKLIHYSTLLLLGSACASSDPDGGTATVHTFEEGTSASGRIAIFQTPDGAAREVLTTGDDGLATASIAAGDMVTVANVSSPQYDLTTFAEVSPGDVMTVGETAFEGAMGVGDIGAVPVTFSRDVVGAARYETGLGLGFVEASRDAPTLHLTEHDLDARGEFRVVGLARDAGGRPLAFSVGASSALTAGAPVTLPSWRTDWDTVSFSVAGLGSADRVEAQVDLLQGARGRIRGDLVTSTASRFGVEIPRDVGGELAYAVEVKAGDSVRAFHERGPARAMVAIDLDATMLPTITNVTVEASADAHRPVIRWNIAGDPAGADYLMLRLSWGEGAHRWTIVLPPTRSGAFQLPELPVELGEWAPGADLRIAAGLIDLSSIANYSAVLRRGIEEIEVLGAAGTFRSSERGELGL